MDKQIIVGSKAFFEGMPDFNPKDTDTLVWVTEPNGFHYYRQTTISGHYTIEWRAMSKDELIAHAMRDKAIGLEFGKFLVPEFIDLIGLTLEDLKQLRSHFADRIDAKHRYQLAICEAYLQNGAFTLTDEQRETAFQAYQDERKTDMDDYGTDSYK